MVDFEKAFDEFIDRREYDAAQAALFSIVRISFAAGWQAAGGNPLKSQKVIELLCNTHKEISFGSNIGVDIKADYK